jgi:hypothetical protein
MLRRATFFEKLINSCIKEHKVLCDGGRGEEKERDEIERERERERERCSASYTLS